MTLDTRDQFDGHPTVVGMFCQTDIRRTLLRYFLTEIAKEHTHKRTTGDIIDDTGVSRNSVRNHIDLFIESGLVIEHDADQQFTHYEPNTDSDVFTIFRDCDEILSEATNRDVGSDVGVHLTDLYGSDSRRILTDFFFYLGDEWDETENDPLTKKDIHRNSGVTRKSIIKEIDVLIEYNIVDEDMEFTYPRYRPYTGSLQFRYLRDANLAINDYLSTA